MAVITTNYFSGGGNLTPNDSAGTPDLATVLRAFVTDITQLRTALTELGTKLDADSGVNDTDYNATIVADIATQQNTLS